MLANRSGPAAVALPKSEALAWGAFHGGYGGVYHGAWGGGAYHRGAFGTTGVHHGPGARDSADSTLSAAIVERSL